MVLFLSIQFPNHTPYFLIQCGTIPNFTLTSQQIPRTNSVTQSMESHQNQTRIKAIYRMLIELANGNLSYRIPLDETDQQFNEIVLLLNQTAQKMQRVNYYNPFSSFSPSSEAADDPATAMIQKVQEYILNHLEEALPATKELSKMLGTNEFTLKYNFRTIAKTSIYQFYNDERLKKAHFLIQQTSIPLKEISFLCGFNDYTNFFKAFKKKYQYAPSELNRNSSDR